MKTLISEDELQIRVKQLGEEISTSYNDRNLLLLCILKGGVVFLSDLMRQISIPIEIDFLAVKSYGEGVRESTGVVQIVKDLDEPIDGKNILIVEDIIDTGYTLEYIIRNLKARDPLSIRICTLLDKIERRKVDIPIDYVGFTIPDKFVVGYGLDVDEKYRELSSIKIVGEAIGY